MLQRLRSERRAFSRDGARQFAQPNPSGGPNRVVRRKQHQRGDISALVHGPHDRAWLYSGTENASGQARVNAKRQQRAEYWRTIHVVTSAGFESAFRNGIDLLADGARIVSTTDLPLYESVLFNVHIPGMPQDAVGANPVYLNEDQDEGTSTPVLDELVWYRADGSRIEAEAGTPQ